MTRQRRDKPPIIAANQPASWLWIAKRAEGLRRKSLVSRMGPGAQRLRKRCIVLHFHTATGGH